jgi:hypothetical protein
MPANNTLDLSTKIPIVGRMLRELRAEGLERDLLQHVWRRLEDQALLDREDLRESIDQLLHGDVVVLRPSDCAGISST